MELENGEEKKEENWDKRKKEQLLMRLVKTCVKASNITHGDDKLFSKDVATNLYKAPIVNVSSENIAVYMSPNHHTIMIISAMDTSSITSSE